MKYEIHEYASLVPMANTAEQTALNLSVKEDGLKEPITIWQGKIVDGRCRQIACEYAGERIRVKELDSDSSRESVKAYVKAVNTRRNLTPTQKVIAALKERNSTNVSIPASAASWGVGVATLNNAIFIEKQQPDFIECLFDGESVSIIDRHGNETVSNKINPIYAYLKRLEQAVIENKEHAWEDDAYIRTQAGKEWHQNFISANPKIKGDKNMIMALAELANYKFKETK